MEIDRFDKFTRALTGSTDGLSRRVACGLLAGGLLAAGLARVGLEDAAAKKCNKKRGKARKNCRRKRCKKADAKCPKHSRCCSKRCCLGIGAPETGPTFCVAKGATCCSAEEGGGACEDHGVCCLPEDGGGCCPTDNTCCFDEQNEPACCPVEPEGLSAASARSGRRPRLGSTGGE